ncbi:MAG: YkgJ family cysteine cluster protein [Rhodospirillales bacterium]|nr:MAG: YkgJ family cysteine cluster protein [Rhodospirillales bacterium]
MTVSVPDGDIPARAILPALRRIVDANTVSAAAAVEARGEAVSCRAGCAACCRQAVPLSDIEAREVAAIVEALPEPRRAIVRSRFAATAERLAAWRPLDALMDWDAAAHRDAYFGLALPCPFLDDERCSIYEQRPLACREFMVTSPPQMCFDAEARHDVRDVPRQFMEPGLRFLSSLDEAAPRRTTILLPLALRWSETAPAEPLRSGADWFQRLGTTLRALAPAPRAADAPASATPPAPAPATAPAAGPAPLGIDTAAAAGTMKATLNLSVSGRRVDVDVAIPTGVVPHSAIVPVAQAVTNAIVATASDASAARGAPVSCRAGCAACCRQVAPVSTAEAHRLAALVAAMPAPVQREVRARFADVERRTTALGMFERLFHLEKAYPESPHDFGLRYFAERIDCPFLVDERCMIHAERPLTCREYLATSPAENCSDLAHTDITTIEAPRLSGSLRRLGAPEGAAPPAIAVSVALAWVDRNPVPPPPRPGQEWFKALFERVMARPAAGDDETTG